MRRLSVAFILLLGLACHGFAQSKSDSPCTTHNNRTFAAPKASATSYVEICKVPNEQERPAISIVLSSGPDGERGLRVYSFKGGKPPDLDGIYVERNGYKQFILHTNEIEWPDGSLTKLDMVIPEERKKLVAVIEAAQKVLKGAAANNRIPYQNSQEATNVRLLLDFMFNYKITRKPIG